MIILAYIGVCFFIAAIGVNRKFGYWGYFFCSFFLTPVVGAIILLASDRRPKKFSKCPKCDYSLVRRI